MFLICAMQLHRSTSEWYPVEFETITFAEEPERQPGFLLKATEVEFLSPRKELDDAAELPAAA